ncbi:uncharacterized protein LOC143190938 isoform X1 [Rhynchophorus ferrugineus]|uniref:uncharacterized protein LOC143190938 isoform X1 n=1 Tax=Rhynchophorus ferrugineus TaxID=354439 RepID=UPI003FCD959D
MENILKCILESDPSPNLLDSTIKVTEDIKHLNVLLNSKLTYLNGSDPDNKISFNVAQIYNNNNNDFELLKETLRKALLVSKDVNEVLIQLMNYITVNSGNSELKIKITHLLDILIKFCHNENKFDLLFNCINYEFLIEFLLNTVDNESIKIQVYDIILNCFSIISTNIGVKYVNILFEYAKKNLNFDLFCFVLSEVSPEMAADKECCFNDDLFWYFMEDCLERPIEYLQKQILYILRVYINKFYFIKDNKFIFLSNDPQDSWNIFFTLIDIGKEKQLHLVEPALNLFTCLNKFHFIWQKCIYRIYLNHTQNSIVYNTTMYIIQQNYTSHELKLVLKLVLPAINRNDYSDSTNAMFSLFKNFCQNMPQSDYESLLDEILLLTWTPVSLCKVIQNIFASCNKKSVCIDYFHDIINCIVKLPHSYLKSECLKCVINNFWDGKSFHKIYKMALSLQGANVDYRRYFLNFHIFEEIIDFLINELLILNDADVPVDKLEICFYFIEKLNYSILPRIIGKYLHKLNCYVRLFIWHHYLKSTCYAQIEKECSLSVHNFCIEFFQEHLDKKTAGWFLNMLLILGESNENALSHISDMLIKTCLNPESFTKEQVFISLAVLSRYPKLLIDVDNEISEKTPLVFEQITDIWKSRILSEKDENICKEFIQVIFRYNNKKMSVNKTIELIEIFQLMFDSHRNEVLLCIYEHLIHFVNVSEAPELVIKFINTCHARLSNLKKDFYFKKILINFVNTIYSVEYLSKSKESAFLMSDSLLEYSKAYPVVRLHMITAIKKILKCDDIYGGSEWLTTIVDIYLQGVITTKDERTEYFICQEFLEINKSFVFENIINISEQSNPNIINTACRIISLDAILDLAKNSVAKVIISLRTEYLKFFKKRYFPNSETHIKKLRITQALLLILPYVKEFSKEAIQIGVFLLDCILEEANQPCIKQIFNLVLIILLQGAAFRGIEYIKRVMSMSAQVSPSIQIGLMPTFYHLALFDTEDPMRSFSAVMSLVLPWTMGSQFKVRIYAQDIIKRLIHEAKENNYDDFLNKYQHLESCIDTSIKATGPVYENTLKTDLIFLNYCNPISDNSSKTVLYDIPRLNSVISIRSPRRHY